MKARILLAAGAALLIGSAASAANSGKKHDPNKKVCRTISETGSRLNKTRACHTQAEWDELRRQTKAKIENIQNNRPWNT
jgi:hypothetical protein